MSIGTGYNAKIRDIAEVLQPVFAANDWKWATGFALNVPDVDDIENMITRLVSQIFGVGTTISCGRISVRRSGNDDFCISLEMGHYTSQEALQDALW